MKMRNFKLKGLPLFVAAMAFALGLSYGLVARADDHNHSYRGSGATNSKELIDAVQRTNAGWDWVPRCANGAHWSWNDNRCKGGTKHHHDNDHHHHHHHHD